LNETPETGNLVDAEQANGVSQVLSPFYECVNDEIRRQRNV